MVDLESKAMSVVETAATKEGILNFLNVLVNNPHLSFLNLLLVYEQKPTAKMVCGRKAWEQMGHMVCDEAEPIKLLFPHIKEMMSADKSVYHVEYRDVNCFDLDSTQGSNSVGKKKQIIFADRITQLTGATWELISEEALRDTLVQGFYDEKENIFYLSRNCTTEQQDQVELELYIDYVLAGVGLEDKLLKMAVTYVINEHYHLKNTIISALFGRLGKYTTDEKSMFLRNVQRVSKQIMDDLDGIALSFNETAFINDLLLSDNPEDIVKELGCVMDSIEDVHLKEELYALKEKLVRITPDCVAKLYKLKCERKLFTYPPVYLEVDEMAYLRTERSSYYGEE